MFTCKACIALVAFASAAAIPLTGSSECYCVNHTQDAYGFGCQAHDINGTDEIPQCSVTDPLKPSWCSDQWCYVDASTCRITYELSTTYPGLGWSYTTCGYRDLYSHENITQSLRNKTLRVAFLGNTGGWKGNYCEGAAGQLCMKQRGSGPVQRFFDLLAGTAGFEIQQVKEMPDAAYEQMMRVRPQGSPFDLCSWATGMGFVDACVASIVLLPRRIDATPFVTLWAEPTILVGPVVEKRSEESLTLGYMLLAAFRPFSAGLWLTMLGVVIFTSLMITYFETGADGQFKDLRRKRDRLAEAVYRAFYSLCMCESRFEPTTLGGRIVGLGLAFLLILLVCGYTATLASFLVVEKRVAPEIDSLDDAIRRNFKVCAHISHKQTLIAGGMDEANVIVIGSRSQVLEEIHLGTLCDVGAMSSEDFEAAQAANRGSYCNLERIGLPLGSIMVGIPVSDKWVKQLRYVVTQLSMDGHLQQSLTQYRPQAYCSTLDPESTVPEALTVEGMLGPFLVTLFLTLFGIVAHILRLGLRKTTKAAHDLGIDEKVSSRLRKLSPRRSRTGSRSSQESFDQKRPKLTQSSSGKWSDFSSEAGSPGRNLRQLEDESFSPGRSPGRDPREEGRDERRALAAVKTYLENHESNVMAKLESIERFVSVMMGDEHVAVSH